MTSLRERLTWDQAQGALLDGSRRYLMMRPDVLMGAIAGLPEAMRGQALQAWAEAARERGADSLRAYARDVKGDGAALISATVGAAADLGWGRWKVRQQAAQLLLEVDSSPFATGWPAHISATGPVCAPVQGLFSALSTLVLGGTPRVEETRCLACGGSSCRFIARRAS